MTSAGQQLHILVVDDDPAMRQLVSGYLQENALRVTAVATGAEMAQALAERAINLVVLDLRLASEDGMQLARKLREESAVPIIIVTGKKDEADRVMCLELGADDYVTKPFSPRELLARTTARSLAPQRRRGLRPLGRRADPEAAPQDRARPGPPAVHPHRARHRLRV